MNQRQRNAWIEAVEEQALRNAEVSDECEVGLMELYDECVNGLRDEMRALYNRYVRDDQLTGVQASRLLTGKEYSIWEKSLEGYLEELEGQRRDSWLALELNTLAAKSQVSRKEQLLTNAYHNMSCLASRSETGLTRLLEGLVQTDYECKMFDIQSIGGVAWDVSKANGWLLEQILSYPWSGRQYSRALWGNTDQLAALTHRELIPGFMSGASVDKIAKEIDDVMGKERYTAQRLIRIGASCFANQGQLLAYQDIGVTKHRFLGGGYEICQHLSGRAFELSGAHTGEGLPPIHLNCKCTTAATCDVPVFKQHQENSLESNLEFEKRKKKHMEGADQVESGPGQEPVKKSISASLRERREATGLLQPYTPKVKMTGEVNQANYRKVAVELERQLAKTPLQKLDGITIFDSRDTPGKIDSAVGKQLRMGTAFMNTPGRYCEGSVLNWAKQIETSMGELRMRLDERISEVVREAYSRQMELECYSRGNVLCNDREIACVIQYEMVHMIINEIEMRGGKELKECYSRAMKSGDVYSISYRASGSERKFICKAAVIYENGESMSGYAKRPVRECKSYEA